MDSEIVAGVDLTVPVHQLRTSKAGRETALQTGRLSSSAAEAYRNRKRSKPPSKWDARQFVAWDGEGITDSEGRHRYVILANSLGDALVDPSGIGTAEAFRMFLGCAELYPRAVHVVFAGGYDVNMILSGMLERHQARILADTGMVTLRTRESRYRVIYHPRHTFELAEERWNPLIEKLEKLRRFCLWDVFGSFQSSFVKACQRTLTADGLAELDHITDMKGKRGSFTAEDIPEMLEYCRAELRALVKLCQADRDNFEAAGFKATRWDGAGAKASAVLRGKKVGEHKRELDDELVVPVRSAYAGGRIECVRFGNIVGDLHTVDIRSAYPWAATFLPSLAGGYWERIGNVGPSSDTEFAVWLVNYKGHNADDLHPFFWRSPDGRICYPQMTEGWYWSPEVWQALRHGRGRVKILDGWKFIPSGSERPFSFIPELFRARRALEASRKGRGWPLKLALNSLYGKMAQQIGGKDGKPPRWHQLEWAGWITSKVRATMYDLCMGNLPNVVSIQTDGITFTGPALPSLSGLSGDKLGDLEVESFDAGTFVQSGIYWLHDADGWHDPKVRGVGAGILEREAFVSMWERQCFTVIPIEVTRFRGLVTSCLTEERWGEWCQWVTEKRDLAVAPSGKRIHVEGQCPACLSWSVNQLHETLPTGGGSRSALHSLAWESKVGRTTSDEWWLDSLDTEDSYNE